MSPLDLERYSIIIFDYDSTVARIPINWPKARDEYRSYLKAVMPDLDFPQDARVDEMESLALKRYPAKKQLIFKFRLDLETKLDGSHEAVPEVVDLIQDLRESSKVTLVIISNNLRRTVLSGLSQLSLTSSFNTVLGVDDIGEPKPSTRAFERIQKEYGAGVEDCLFIGDNERTDGGFCQALGIAFHNIYKEQI